MIVYKEGKVVLLHILLSGYIIHSEIDLYCAEVFINLGQREIDHITHIADMLGSEDGFLLG